MLQKTIKIIFLLCFFINVAACEAVTIIGIAGGTGAGKTTVANQIKERLGDEAVIISQDSYYKDLSSMTAEERRQVNFDHPDSIEFSLLKKHLLELKKGNVIKVPIYDFASDTRTKAVSQVSPTDIIIVEGTLLLAIAEIRDLVDIKVFLDVKDDLRLLRRIKRDIEERGRTIASVQKQYLTTVRPMHQMFVAPSKQYADIIIPGGLKIPLQ